MKPVLGKAATRAAQHQREEGKRMLSTGRIVTAGPTNCPGAANVDKAALHIGAVAFIHRVESSLNGQVHFHVCVVDGVFEEVAGHAQAHD